MKDLVLSGADISDNPKALEYSDLIKNFTIPKFEGQVEIYDPTVNVTASPRNEAIREKEQEIGFKYEREFVWIDGAETANGVIVLPYDDYDTVYVVKGTKKQPELIIIAEGQEGDWPPYYYKRDGKTYVVMEGFSGAGGTQSSPYPVSTPQDFFNINNNLSASYIQTNDIDFSGINFTQIAGVSTVYEKFTGTYDGNGYSLKNITINDNNVTYKEPAVFGIAGGVIKNVFIKNITINVTKDINRAGGLVGFLYYGKIENCAVEGVINSTDGHVGGLVGGAYNSSIKNCYAKINMQQSTSAKKGGFICDLQGTTIQNCYSASIGSVSPFVHIIYSNVSIVQCYYDKDLSGGILNLPAIGKTTAEMKQQSTYQNWDFVNIWSLKSDSYPDLVALRTDNILEELNNGDGGGGGDGDAGGGTTPNGPSPIYLLKLINANGIWEICIASPDDPNLKYNFFRIITADGQIGCVDLIKIDELDGSESPFRIITHKGIFALRTVQV